MPSEDQIVQALTASLNPHDHQQRKSGEKFLQESMTQENFGPMVLKLVTTSTEQTQLIAAITFKNFVVKYWGSLDDGDNKIPLPDRDLIKNEIVDIMLVAPAKLQKQLSVAITHIATFDFPSKWEALLTKLTENLFSQDFNKVNGVLSTVHSITKRYKFSMKSEELWQEIKLVLVNFYQPLSELFKNICNLIAQHANDKAAITVLVESLVYCAKIYFSLSYQDLPEELEDTLSLWMPRFQEILSFENPVIEREALDSEPTSIEILKSNIIEIVNLYTQKYDEEFEPYLQDFIMKIWQLLTEAQESPRFDTLVFTGMQFLCTISKRTQTNKIFGEDNPNNTDGPIQQIFSKIIVPNSRLRETDVENFEDNPDEFIRSDLEGSDTDTRRKAASDLVKALSEHFEKTMTALAGAQIAELMSMYNSDQAEKWVCKEAALFLVTSLITKSQTRKNGVTAVSDLVNLHDFFDENIFNEMSSSNKSPVLIASCVKFSIHFRNQIGKERASKTLASIAEHLTNESIVLKSYSAHTIEKLLVTNDYKFSLADIGETNINKIVNNLCRGVVESENKFMMRALLRILSLIYKDSNKWPIPSSVTTTLKGALDRANKNPADPTYNHYMFENIAASVRINLKNGNLMEFQKEFFPIGGVSSF